MPNWCVSRLVVEGPADDVTRLVAQVDDDRNRDRDLRTALSLEKIVPMPGAVK
jgi:hypothetical protein